MKKRSRLFLSKSAPGLTANRERVFTVSVLVFAVFFATTIAFAQSSSCVRGNVSPFDGMQIVQGTGYQVSGLTDASLNIKPNDQLGSGTYLLYDFTLTNNDDPSCGATSQYSVGVFGEGAGTVTDHNQQVPNFDVVSVTNPDGSVVSSPGKTISLQSGGKKSVIRVKVEAAHDFSPTTKGKGIVLIRLTNIVSGKTSDGTSTILVATATECKQNPPNIKIEPANGRSGMPGDQLDYLVTVTNENTGACDPVQFRVTKAGVQDLEDPCLASDCSSSTIPDPFGWRWSLNARFMLGSNIVEHDFLSGGQGNIFTYSGIKYLTYTPTISSPSFVLGSVDDIDATTKNCKTCIKRFILKVKSFSSDTKTGPKSIAFCVDRDSICGFSGYNLGSKSSDTDVGLGITDVKLNTPEATLSNGDGSSSDGSTSTTPARTEKDDCVTCTKANGFGFNLDNGICEKGGVLHSDVSQASIDNKNWIPFPDVDVKNLCSGCKTSAEIAAVKAQPALSCDNAPRDIDLSKFASKQTQTDSGSTSATGTCAANPKANCVDKNYKEGQCYQGYQCINGCIFHNSCTASTTTTAGTCTSDPKNSCGDHNYAEGQCYKKWQCSSGCVVNNMCKTSTGSGRWTSSSTLAIAATDKPTTANAGDNLAFKWTVSGIDSFSGEGHTNVHCFKEGVSSVKAADSISDFDWIASHTIDSDDPLKPYPVYSEKVAQKADTYQGNVKTDVPGKYYCRIYASADDKQYKLSDIYTVDVGGTAATTATGKCATDPKASCADKNYKEGQCLQGYQCINGCIFQNSCTADKTSTTTAVSDTTSSTTQSSIELSTFYPDLSSDPFKIVVSKTNTVASTTQSSVDGSATITNIKIPANVKPGDTVTFNWKVAGIDSFTHTNIHCFKPSVTDALAVSSITEKQWTYAGSDATVKKYSVSSTPLRKSSDGSYTSTLTFTDEGTYYCRIHVVQESTTTVSSTATFTSNVPLSGTSITVPHIEQVNTFGGFKETQLAKLMRDPRAGETATFDAAASDDVQLKYIEIFVDGKSIGVCPFTNTKFGYCSKTAGPWAEGSKHSYYVEAKNARGESLPFVAPDLKTLNYVSATPLDFTVQSATSNAAVPSVYIGLYQYETAYCNACLDYFKEGYDKDKQVCEKGTAKGSTETSASAQNKNWAYYSLDSTRDQIVKADPSLQGVLSCEGFAHLITH